MHMAKPSDASTLSGFSGASLDQALESVAAGDRDAFAEVYQRTSVKLLGVCRRILPERQEAEEVLQDIYLTVWRRAGAFDATRGSAMTWLITLARNRAVDRLRAGARRPTDPIEYADHVADSAPDAEASAIASDDAERLAYCMGRIDTGDAGLIRTAFFEGATYTELAERVARPLGTIKSRIRRALIALRECLA
jgi:RNA polymerase sigma factor (sigma-70 family)